MKVERSNFILVPNSALSTNVFLQSKCNMHGRYDHASWSWCACITVGTEFENTDSSLIMPDFDLTAELSLKIELHMLRPITEKVHSGNGPVSLVPPGYGFWSLPIFAHYSALQYVVQGNLWIFWFNEEPLWLFKFPWTISKVPIKNSFFNPLEKVKKKTKSKKFFTEPKMVLNHIFGTIFGSVFYFWNFFFVLWGFSWEDNFRTINIFFISWSVEFLKGVLRITLKYPYSTTWKNLGPMSRG